MREMSELRVSPKIKLAVKKENQEPTIIQIGDASIGGEAIAIIAGPCAVETKEQLLETARAVKKAGATMLRGGAFKPRTLPYSFQGLGEEGLRLLAEAREETGLPVVTEVTSPGDVSLVESYADILQIGARNMQNYPLLKRVGQAGKPALLKRAMTATIEEWLGTAEYILHGGNPDVILCERGVRAFQRLTRNTLDISAVPIIKEVSHLPVVVDPSHGTGVRSLVAPMSRAAIAAGADGLLLEVHHKPEAALCDGAQSLRPQDFQDLMTEIEPLARAIGRRL